jgi:cyclophilin family peptidyl-prolyl cis-trans isomerase
VTSSSGGSSSIKRHYSTEPAITIDPNRAYTATIDTSEGAIVVKLDASTAPKSVNNFVFLAQHRFYDGLTIHRVAKDFIIQGGDPKGTGAGDPGYKVQAEVPQGGYQVGSLAWAKANNEPPGTAGSQFFVVTSPAPAAGQGLDVLNKSPYQYGIIGQVSQGLDVAQKIGALVPPTGDGRPTKPVKIKKVTIKVSKGLAPPSS